MLTRSSFLSRPADGEIVEIVDLTIRNKLDNRLGYVEKFDIGTTEVDDDEQDLCHAGLEPEESSDSEYDM
uniref:Uncharacterized protein n=1 Tax=Romanomermis culicivorax TaxID=13658 RepID=A0A915JM83_ROMCU